MRPYCKVLPIILLLKSAHKAVFIFNLNVCITQFECLLLHKREKKRVRLVLTHRKCIGSGKVGITYQEIVEVPVDLLDALRLISVTINLDTCVVNCSRSENFSFMELGGAFPNTCHTHTHKHHLQSSNNLLFMQSFFSPLQRCGPVELKLRFNQQLLPLMSKEPYARFVELFIFHCSKDKTFTGALKTALQHLAHRPSVQSN